MLRDIGEAHTHHMGRGIVAFYSSRPDSLCGCDQKLEFSGTKDQAEVAWQFNCFTAADKSTDETEVFRPSTDDTFVSYYSYRPKNFNSGMTAFVNSHEGAPLFEKSNSYAPVSSRMQMRAVTKSGIDW